MREDGVGDPGGGGDGDTGWGASAFECQDALLAQHMVNCSVGAQLPLTNNNAIAHSESTNPAVADSAIAMQDNDNDQEKEKRQHTSPLSTVLRTDYGDPCLAACLAACLAICSIFVD